jgi:uncharacterized BrkB/YihY/UPF0761 family membrane protein
MPKLKPQTRFLLRGSALLVGLLSLWWFLLLPPMLSVLKGAAGAFLFIQENPSGDWTLRVPLEKTLPATPQQPVAQQVHSIDFDIPRSDVIAFTFSLPVFWAILLAAPGVRRNLRPLLVGTAVMAAVEVAMLLAFAEISARGTAAQLAGNEDAAGKWARQFGEYLLASVLPYATPFVVALSLHRGLGAEIFPWSSAVEAPASAPPLDRAQKRRLKKRRP